MLILRFVYGVKCKIWKFIKQNSKVSYNKVIKLRFVKLLFIKNFIILFYINSPISS